MTTESGTGMWLFTLLSHGGSPRLRGATADRRRARPGRTGYPDMKQTRPEVTRQELPSRAPQSAAPSHQRNSTKNAFATTGMTAPTRSPTRQLSKLRGPPAKTGGPFRRIRAAYLELERSPSPEPADHDNTDATEKDRAGRRDGRRRRLPDPDRPFLEPVIRSELLTHHRIQVDVLV